MVTFADIFAVQPFRNPLVTLTLTGKQIKTCSSSNGSSRSRRASCRSRRDSAIRGTTAKPYGDLVLAEGITLNGRPSIPRRATA